MTTYSLHVAAILSSAIVAIGFAGPVAADPRSAPEHTLLAQAASEDTMARCQQLFGLWSRHNTDGYAKPLDARMAMEDCQKGNYAAGVASLKRALERSQIPVPPAEAVAQTPAQPPAQLKPRGEKRRAAE
jgi:hypothetical protein